MGIGRNVGLTPKLQHKNKSRQWSGVDLILEQSPVTSSFQILKASAAGQTYKASLPLRQCSNVIGNHAATQEKSTLRLEGILKTLVFQ